MPLYLKQANPSLPLGPSLYDSMMDIFIRNIFILTTLLIYVIMCFVEESSLKLYRVRVGGVVVGLYLCLDKNPPQRDIPAWLRCFSGMPTGPGGST